LKTLDYSQVSFLMMVPAFLYIAARRVGSFLKYRQARAG